MIRPRTTGIPGTAVRRVLGAPLLALPCCSAPRPLWQSLPASVVTRVWIAALIVLISLGASSAHAAASNTESDAAAFLRAFSDRAIAMLSDDAVSQEQRSGEFRSLLQSGFDMVLIGRTVLGRHWRTATARQRAEFLQLFEDFVVLAYGSRMSAYSGETLEIGSARLHGDKDAVVRSRVLSSDRPPVTVAAATVRGRVAHRRRDCRRREHDHHPPLGVRRGDQQQSRAHRRPPSKAPGEDKVANVGA